jgi:hypothetical protein
VTERPLLLPAARSPERELMAHIFDTTCTCTGCELLRLSVQRDADFQKIDELIERSSLGTPEAKAIRARTPQAAVDAIMERVAEIEAQEARLKAQRWTTRVGRRLAQALAAVSRLVGQ